MKIVCVDGDDLFVLPDTALLRNNEPFFAPDFATEITAVEGVSARIIRMTKCIETRFASRTWEQCVRCVDYRAGGVQQMVGRGFDRSFAVAVEMDDKERISSEMRDIIDQKIAYASRFFTLKIGDYVFVAQTK